MINRRFGVPRPMLCGVVLLLLAAACASSGVKPVELFSATYVLPTQLLTERSSPQPTNIIVYRYATPEELDEFGRVLQQKGSAALLEMLAKYEMGRLTTNTPDPGLALRLVYQVPTPEGRRIVAITERPISFLEVWYSTRSLDYEFAYLELNVDTSGRGEGRLVRAGQIQSIGANTLLVTNYETQPVRLLSVAKR